MLPSVGGTECGFAAPISEGPERLRQRRGGPEVPLAGQVAAAREHCGSRWGVDLLPVLRGCLQRRPGRPRLIFAVRPGLRRAAESEL